MVVEQEVVRKSLAPGAVELLVLPVTAAARIPEVDPTRLLGLAEEQAVLAMVVVLDKEPARG